MTSQNTYIILLIADLLLNQNVINNKTFTYKKSCIQQQRLLTFSVSCLCFDSSCHSVPIKPALHAQH
jgi:hypothetical protein